MNEMRKVNQESCLIHLLRLDQKLLSSFLRFFTVISLQDNDSINLRQNRYHFNLFILKKFFTIVLFLLTEAKAPEIYTYF